MKIHLPIMLILALCGCSQEQVASAGNSIAKTYLESQKDKSVKNWQAKVSPAPACVRFKDDFHATGKRFDDAANGAFQMEMIKIWNATKAAKCAAHP